MSPLSRWRERVNAKGLTKAEKEKDLRRFSNIEAFEEFKAKRAGQQRRRRHRAKTNSGGPSVQFIQVKDGVEVFYVDLAYLKEKGHKIKNKVYTEKSAKKMMARLVKKSNRKMSDFDLLYHNLSKKNRVSAHESNREFNEVFAVIVVH